LRVDLHHIALFNSGNCPHVLEFGLHFPQKLRFLFVCCQRRPRRGKQAGDASDQSAKKSRRPCKFFIFGQIELGNDSPADILRFQKLDLCRDHSGVNIDCGTRCLLRILQ
jgi:hypothetical protein